MIQKCLEVLLIPFVRIMLHIYFRQIEVAGKERVPRGVPLIYTPNHFNSVIDGLLARVFLPHDPRPLAKSTLWDIRLLRPLLVAVGAIPVYRQQDAIDESYVARNKGTFSACYDALAEGASIVLFPEGQSHSEPELQEIKTGAARIALGAEQRRGPLGIRIIPVGLTFDAKQRFRSRVLISVGEPLDPLEGLGEANAEDREAVKLLTRRIQQGIKSVTLNYPSWEEANIMSRAADLYVKRSSRDEASSSLAAEFSAHKQLSDAYPLMKECYPRKVSRIVDAVNAYDRLLKVLSIRHEHVVQEHPKLLQTIYSLRKLSLFVIRLPLALLGIFLNAAPYSLTALVGQLKIRADRASTAKLVAGLILYPLCWTLQSGMLENEFFPAYVWWILAPLSGVSSLLFRERHAQLLEELRTYLKLNNHVEMKEELEQRLENICIEVTELLAISAASQRSAREWVTEDQI